MSIARHYCSRSYSPDYFAHPLQDPRRLLPAPHKLQPDATLVPTPVPATAPIAEEDRFRVPTTAQCKDMVPFRVTTYGGTAIDLLPHFDKLGAVIAGVQFVHIDKARDQVMLYVPDGKMVVADVMRASGVIVGGMLLDFSPVGRKGLSRSDIHRRNVFVIVHPPRDSMVVIRALADMEIRGALIDKSNAPLPSTKTPFAFLTIHAFFSSRRKEVEKMRQGNKQSKFMILFGLRASSAHDTGTPYPISVCEPIVITSDSQHGRSLVDTLVEAHSTLPAPARVLIKNILNVSAQLAEIVRMSGGMAVAVSSEAQWHLNLPSVGQRDLHAQPAPAAPVPPSLVPAMPPQRPIPQPAPAAPAAPPTVPPIPPRQPVALPQSASAAPPPALLPLPTGLLGGPVMAATAPAVVPPMMRTVPPPVARSAVAVVPIPAGAPIAQPDAHLHHDGPAPLVWRSNSSTPSHPADDRVAMFLSQINQPDTFTPPAPQRHGDGRSSQLNGRSVTPMHHPHELEPQLRSHPDHRPISFLPHPEPQLHSRSDTRPISFLPQPEAASASSVQQMRQPDDGSHPRATSFLAPSHERDRDRPPISFIPHPQPRSRSRSRSPSRASSQRDRDRDHDRERDCERDRTYRSAASPPKSRHESSTHRHHPERPPPASVPPPPPPPPPPRIHDLSGPPTSALRKHMVPFLVKIRGGRAADLVPHMDKVAKLVSGAQFVHVDPTRNEIMFYVPRNPLAVANVLRETGVVIVGMWLEFEPVNPNDVLSMGRLRTAPRNAFLVVYPPDSNRFMIAQLARVGFDGAFIDRPTCPLPGTNIPFVYLTLPGVHSGKQQLLDQVDFENRKTRIVPIKSAAAVFANHERHNNLLRSAARETVK
ncbi:hypothetical protein GGF32_006920 [Allomyces javanicus]|nr:hypothetical protein GGF32_006920 [Allomyces javanicus]